MTVYFTSDLHLGHRFVAQLRGFSSVEEHDATIAANWNSLVTAPDLVWVLGDLTLKNPKTVVDQVNALTGRKRLVLGNHDHGHPFFRDAPKFARVYDEMFEWVTTAARVRIQGTEALLSHFPYEADRGDMRFEQWRLPDLGLPLVHGHLHAKEQITSNRPEIHVGLDAWDLLPVADWEVLDMMKLAEVVA